MRGATDFAPKVYKLFDPSGANSKNAAVVHERVSYASLNWGIYRAMRHGDISQPMIG